MKLPTLPPFGKLKKTLATSEAVAVEIARHEDHLAATRAATDAFEAERSAALLDASDVELDAIEGRGREARVALDRLHARREALVVQLAEVLDAEAGAALTRRRLEAEAKATAARKWLEGRYVVLAREMVEGLARINEAEADVAAVNEALEAAGRWSDSLSMVEPMHGLTGIEGAEMVISLPAIAKLTRLVPIEGKAPGWGHTSYEEVAAASMGL